MTLAFSNTFFCCVGWLIGLCDYLCSYLEVFWNEIYIIIIVWAVAGSARRDHVMKPFLKKVVF